MFQRLIAVAVLILVLAGGFAAAPAGAQQDRAGIGRAIDEAGITVHADIPYQALPGVAAERQALDIYTDARFEDAPVVLFIHGGSWRQGSKAAVLAKPLAFVPAGFVVVSANYRFRPDVSVADMAGDVAAAVAWIAAEIGAYGGDGERIFLMGHSAGAHLVATIGTNERFLAGQGLDFEPILGVVPLDTGPYNVPLQMQRTGPTRYGELMRFVFTEDESTWQAVSPYHHVASGKGIAPFLVVASDNRNDMPVQAAPFTERLVAAGIEAELYVAEGLDHGGVNRELGMPATPITEKVLAFLRAHGGM